MSLVFTVLWLIAIGKVLVFPILHRVGQVFFTIAVIAGIWVITGALVYQTHYARYAQEKADFETLQTAFFSKRSHLLSLLSTHPTSRDVLLRLALIDSQIGEHEPVLGYIKTLKEVDPNHPEVLRLLRVIQ